MRREIHLHLLLLNPFRLSLVFLNWGACSNRDEDEKAWRSEPTVRVENRRGPELQSSAVSLSPPLPLPCAAPE